MRKIGVFDPTLDVDAKLFVNPFMVRHSKHPEFSECAFETYEQHFQKIYSLILASKQEGDKAWRAATERFQFSESKGMGGTCLGYSKRGTDGHAFGPEKSKQSVRWAKEVIDLGVKDPELFSALPLFEDGIGVDLISDMFIAISIDCVAKFNSRVIGELNTATGGSLPTSKFRLRGSEYDLIQNPYSNAGAPIILVADDVLDHLPVMDDPRRIPEALESNSELRERVNEHIGTIFKTRTKKDKEHIKDRALASATAFQSLLDLLRLMETEGYDIHNDPDGLLVWRDIAESTVAIHKLDFKVDSSLSKIDRVNSVVQRVIEQFQHLVEDCRLNRVFFHKEEPRHESFAQMLFYAIAASYCEVADIGISPEADAGVGPVDFKFNNGFDSVLVEIKLSTNTQVVSGYKKQLGAYSKAEKSSKNHYVLIDVGKIGGKWDRLNKIRQENSDFAKSHFLHLIDGTLKPSASKRKS
ncbi:hypothetical protein [Aliiroseovarius sp. F20344]|uniref:hypothetical protein n=1 Tax=Aliiroseovarius sp. F20344 TaxID=2926414 RepID=UPI001FF59AA4|nr:hypothetical protein [Aliiroseovarius sp. F20344]MCK0141023.1 hypothetical protein [Aliiroseovarius sp. F20344]